MAKNYNVQFPLFYAESKNRGLILDFQTSGKDFALVEYGADEYKSTASCVAALKNALKRMNCHTVMVKTIQGKVFMLSTRFWEDNHKQK